MALPLGGDIPPNPTIYVNNLYEKLRKEGGGPPHRPTLSCVPGTLRGDPCLPTAKCLIPLQFHALISRLHVTHERYRLHHPKPAH